MALENHDIHTPYMASRIGIFSLFCRPRIVQLQTLYRPVPFVSWRSLTPHPSILDWYLSFNHFTPSQSRSSSFLARASPILSPFLQFAVSPIRHFSYSPFLATVARFCFFPIQISAVAGASTRSSTKSVSHAIPLVLCAPQGPDNLYVDPKPS